MKAYLVFGPEAAGNRYLVHLLGSAGCAVPHMEGFPLGQWDALIHGSWQLQLPTRPLPEFVACGCSWPTQRPALWPDALVQINRFRSAGYYTTVLIPVRAPPVCELSQVRAGHVSSVEEARGNIRRAYQEILDGLHLAGVLWYLVPYQSLGQAGTRQWLQTTLGLPRVPDAAWVNGDVKYL